MDKLIFTRYLYPRTNVQESLLLSLLDSNRNEALFWAYEYYFSGFEQETWAYLLLIYENFYKTTNPDLAIKLFAITEKSDLLVGTIVSTLCTRNYQIVHFVSTYFSRKIPPIVHTSTKLKFIVLFKEEELKSYRTILPDENLPRLYLSSVCKYAIRNNTRIIFDTPYSDIKTELFYMWVYYASRSPVWLDRIEEFDGKVNHEKEQIEFPNSELMDAFYNLWGLEPDEQSKTTIEKCIGTSSLEQQLSIDDFCDYYL